MLPRIQPLALVVLLVLCACGSECLQSTKYQHTIYIDPGNPNSVNDSSCYTNSVEHPCGDINIALAFPDKQHSTIFYLSSNANHKLAYNATNMLFTEGSQIAFIGDNGTATVECMEGAGLAFINSTNISITSVSFLYCGAWRPSTSLNFTSKTLQLLSIRVGMYFYNCRNVNMSCMSVSNSTEAVGVVMYSVAGENYIGYSHFDNNRINESNKNESGGGGFAVEFNYCKPGDNTCGDNNTQTENISDAVYVFEGCSFSFNRGIDQSGENGSDTSILPRKATHSSLGRGGGLSLYFKGTAMKNNITINNCNFSHNNATWGAGLIIEIADSTIQNVVNVAGSHFTDNNCYVTESNKGGSGGGVRVSSVVYYTHPMDKLLMRNSVSFDQCNFIRNRALLGGAMSLSYHHQQFSHHHQVFEASVSGCTFDFNSARLGSAVSVDNENYYPKGELGSAIFSSCVFTNNTIVYVDSEIAPYSVGIGALYVSEVPVTFTEFLIFQLNNGTALAVVGTTVNISDKTYLVFIKNSGSNGGAISLLGIATLFIGKGTSFLFSNNFARLNGGAIFNNYIGKEDLRSSVKCFLQYADPFENPKIWDTKFTFDSNQAGKLGQSIFSSTILPCSRFQDATSDRAIVKEIFCWNNSTWVYKNSTCIKEIHTSPGSFLQEYPNQPIFPGHPFYLQIVAKDDLGHNVSSNTVYTAYTSNPHKSEVEPPYAYISDQYVGISGSEDQNITLKLNTAGHRDWHIEINLEMQKCPPGFVASMPTSYILRSSSDSAYLVNNTCKCIGGPKRPNTFRGNLICNKDSMISEIRNGYWIGVVPAYNNTKLYMGSTALLHRYSEIDTFPISQRYDRLDYNQCSHLHRTGPLCGECLKNYSTAVNTFDHNCVQCNRNTTNVALNVVAYLGLTYLPYLVIFVIIIYFDIRLMSGPLVGFILYAQLIGSAVIDLTLKSLPYFKSGDIPHSIQKAYQIAYGIFNLNTFSQFMEPFCIHENLNALDVICLDYAVAAFPLLLIIVIRLLMPLKSFKFFNKKRGIRNVSTTVTANNNMNKPTERPLIHAFVGFIYLSYTKFSLTSTKLFSTTYVFDQDGATPNIMLIYYAGQFYFGQKEYVFRYGLLAITIFIFVAVLLPLLLLGPLDFMNWLTDQPKFYFLNRFWPTLKINIFLDAFRGCYKTNCKYFTGIYFLFRLIIFLVYGFSSNEIFLRVWQLVFVVILLVLVAWKQPYKTKFFNYLDSLILFNVVLINLISIYLCVQKIANVHTDYPFMYYAFGVILIWLPMVYFVLYLCWLILHKRRVYHLAVYRLRPVINCFRKYCGEPALVEEQQPLLNPASSYSDITVSNDTDTDLFIRAEENMRSRYLRRENRKSPNNTNSSNGGSAGVKSMLSSGFQSGGSNTTPNTTNSSKSSGVHTD